MLSYSRDKYECVVIPLWGGGRRTRYATPDLSYYLEGGRESSAGKINGMKE